MRIYLASRSEQRRRLLEEAGFDVVVVEPGCEEPSPSSPPDEYVLTVARMKALSVIDRIIPVGGIILGADTVVEIDGRLIGKPVDVEDAERILTESSGRIHRIYTGLYLTDTKTGRSESGVASATVKMNPLTENDVKRIIEQGRSLGRAGAYAMREDGEDDFVELLEGTTDTVVGLPIHLVNDLLKRLLEGEEECSRE